MVVVWGELIELLVVRVEIRRLFGMGDIRVGKLWNILMMKY